MNPIIKSAVKNPSGSISLELDHFIDTSEDWEQFKKELDDLWNSSEKEK